MFEKMMPEKKYPFMISNTNRKDPPGMHWWRILNIYPTKSYCFSIHLE